MLKLVKSVINIAKPKMSKDKIISVYRYIVNYLDRCCIDVTFDCESKCTSFFFFAVKCSSKLSFIHVSLISVSSSSCCHGDQTLWHVCMLIEMLCVLCVLFNSNFTLEDCGAVMDALGVPRLLGSLDDTMRDFQETKQWWKIIELRCDLKYWCVFVLFK